MVITHLCFSCCRAVLTLSQWLFSFSHCPASKEAGGAQEDQRGQNQDSWPKLAKGISHTWGHGAACSAIKWWNGGWLGSLGISQRVVSSCTVNHLFCISLYHNYYYDFPFYQCFLFVCFGLVWFLILSPIQMWGGGQASELLCGA